MSRKRQPVKAVQKLFKKVSKQFLSAIKKQIIWLLRTFIATKKRRGAMNAGFVLPTVVMVSLVVVLLTTAILFRSFERAKNASNVRVNEVVLNAAAPAIDRARAKLDALFEDPTLPRGTPTDNSLYDALKKDKYRLGDETRLKLAFDINDDDTIQTGEINDNGTPDDTSDDFVDEDETLKTAWKYAVDTDNNGKKDTFTLYGIYFRIPRTNSSGIFTRERKAIEARTPPMDNDSGNPNCPNALGFSSLVGNSNWYKLNSGNLGKSFFVYTVNVPITNLGSLDTTQYEEYKGNKGIVALEFQQDRTRVPLANNAVWFDNDLEVIVGSTSLLLNGRIHTNGNLLVGVTPATGRSAGEITFRQVSSKKSCFYNQENGQIIVGGNVGNGSLSQFNNNTSVKIDLYQGFGNGITTKVINASNRSTNSDGGASIGFNDAAYNQRIAKMKTDAIALCTSCNSATSASALITAVNDSGYPDDVKRNVATKVNISTDNAQAAKDILYEEIEIYLRNRTRRVPFAEASSSATLASILSAYTTTITASLEPPTAWREPLNSSNQFTSATSITVTPSQLSATNPNLQKKEGVQTELGDRIFVGNNLPAKWLQGSKYVGSEANQLIFSSGTTPQAWTRNGSETQTQRWRNTQIQPLADLGVFDRNGFWEESAATNPANDLDSVGGVRIVTGAGIYVDGTTGASYPRSTNSFLPEPPDPTPSDTTDIPVWPDTMPMTSPDASETKKGDLLMRATAVYHYKITHGTDQTPIACVSSYYDPTNSITSRNKSGLTVTVPPVPPATTPTTATVNLPWNAATGGRSNNGIVYNFPGRDTFATYKDLLIRQGNLKFPNGRWANEPLKNALAKISGTTVPSTGLQLADYSAIDTALCAISILNNEAGFVTPSNQPAHGAIKEASFLDGREAKQISIGTSTTYDLDLEQRQPLEVRVTDIDLGSLANTAIDSEYLLPLSGIIYASRDDALHDESDKTAETSLLSPTDFQLDPTRRPNGIRLINGATLARDPEKNKNAYNSREKGLILTTNLPAYIEGNFNLHRTSTDPTNTTEIEEFQETEATTNFYNRSAPESNFACRKNRAGCDDVDPGDFWRPATIIADSMTLLSGNFQDGFRNEGDYDLNNNTGIAVENNFNPATISTVISPSTTSVLSTLDSRRQNRLKNGFWENNFVTSANSWSLSNLGSYVRNGVSPVQRRVGNYPAYIMEICRKSLISQCEPGDWVVGFDVNGDNDLEDSVSLDMNGDGDTTDTDETLIEKNIKTYHLGKAVIAAAPTGTTSMNSNWWTTPYGTGNKTIRLRLGASDTGDRQALVAADRRFPRRVAFARNSSNLLVESSSGSGIYQPMGLGCPLDITGSAPNSNGCTYTSGTPAAGTNYGITTNNALWFRTKTSSSNATYNNNQSLFYYPPVDANNDGSPDLDGQPLLVPVLQVHDANTNPSNTNNLRGDGVAQNAYVTSWLQQANNNNTTKFVFNATFVLGNSPGRPEETSAGLQNFVRFLENWGGSTTSKISGSFIQLKRSTYATAPLAPILRDRTTTTANDSDNLSLFDYPLDTYPTFNNDGLLPFYNPPDRQWGFDVGLLSEQPDLFAQRFTSPSTGRPNEYFREVGRDDSWVKSLLCAGEASDNTGTTSGATYTTPAVGSEYRSGCPTIPADS